VELRFREVAKYLRALTVRERPVNRVLELLRLAERIRLHPQVWSVIRQRFRLRPAATGCLAEVAVFLAEVAVFLAEVAVYPVEVAVFLVEVAVYPVEAVVRLVVEVLRQV
jgi:hypothetical protein